MQKFSNIMQSPYHSPFMLPLLFNRRRIGKVLSGIHTEASGLSLQRQMSRQSRTKDCVVSPVPYRSQVSADYTARGHCCAVTNVVITHDMGKSLCVACKTLKTSIRNKIVTENNATRFLTALHLISFQCLKPPNSAERGSKTNISSTVHIFQ